jgi:ribosomal protein L44E
MHYQRWHTHGDPTVKRSGGAVLGRAYTRGTCASCGQVLSVKLTGEPRAHGTPRCPGSLLPAGPVTAKQAKERKLQTVEERKAYDRAYYQRTKDRYNASRRGGIRKHTQKRRAMLNRIKLERGCADCGYNAHAIALDFDHHTGEKVKGVSALYVHSLETLMAEIAKCDVVCANCHRIRTAQRAGWASSSLEDHVA